MKTALTRMSLAGGVCRITLPMLVAAATLLAGPAAQAAFVPTDLLISASAKHNGFASPVNPGATQDGDMSATVGGAVSSAVIVDAVATPMEVGGQLTQTGDGTRITLNANGSGALGDIYNAADHLFSLTNNSLTDTFIVSFRVDFDSRADADGDDAFASSSFALCVGSLITCPTRTSISELTSDTLFGDVFNGDFRPTFGDNLVDADSRLFDFTLLPGEMIDFAGKLDLGSGAYSDNASVVAQLTTSFILENVLVEPGIPDPNTVPEPASALLVLLGLGMMGWRHKSARAV